jgi:hypothetical protein
MRKQNFVIGAAACATVVAVVVVALLAGGVAAQSANPRFGKWKLKSDAPAPQSNIMTYEPPAPKA